MRWRERPRFPALSLRLSFSLSPPRVFHNFPIGRTIITRTRERSRFRLTVQLVFRKCVRGCDRSLRAIINGTFARCVIAIAAIAIYAGRRFPPTRYTFLERCPHVKKKRICRGGKKVANAANPFFSVHYPCFSPFATHVSTSISDKLKTTLCNPRCIFNTVRYSACLH